MTRIKQIENALLQMEGGKFQTLLNQYLHRQFSFSEFSAVGSQAGTDKTTPGIPDAYGVVDGRYTLIGCTTEQEKTEAKLMRDAKDCLDESKTGISNDRVERIVLCHNKFRLKGEISERVKSINPKITIIGPEQIAQDLDRLYPALAHTNLGISLGKGAFISKGAFLHRQQSSAFPTDQSKRLQYRDEELANLVGCISKEKVLILGGPSGCGKTKLALDACDAFATKHGWDFVVLEARNSKKADDDIELVVKHSTRLLVMVDDANEQTELEHLLDACMDSEEIKLVLTVRELAKQELERRVKLQARPKMFPLDPLSEVSMGRILEEDYGVTDKNLQAKISSVAHGNMRVAVMAALTYTSAEALEGTHVYDLYDLYLTSALSPYGEKEIEVVEALSIYEYCDLEDDDPCYRYLCSRGMVLHEIHHALIMFNDCEIVSTTTSRSGVFAARIEEQLLRDYFICRYFFAKQKRTLSEFIMDSLSRGTHTHERIIRNLEEVFGSDEMMVHLHNEARIAWQKMMEFPIEERKRFLLHFHHLIPEEALSFVERVIVATPSTDISESLLDTPTGTNSTPESDTLVACSDLPQFRDRAWDLTVQAIAKGFGDANIWRSILGGYGAFTIRAIEDDFSFEKTKIEGLTQAYEEAHSPNIAGALLILADALIGCRPERPIRIESGQRTFIRVFKPTEGLTQLLESCIKGLFVLLDSPYEEAARKAFRKLFEIEKHGGKPLGTDTLARVIESTHRLIPSFLSIHSISNYRCWKFIQSIRATADPAAPPLSLGFPDTLQKATEIRDGQDRYEDEIKRIDVAAWTSNDIRDVLAFLLEDICSGEDYYLSEKVTTSVLVSLAEQLPINEAHNQIEKWLDDAENHGFRWFSYAACKSLVERTSPNEELRWADTLDTAAGKWTLVNYLEGIALATSPTDYVLDAALLHVREGGVPQAIEAIFNAGALRSGYAAAYAKLVAQSPELPPERVCRFLGKRESELQRKAYTASFSEQPDVLRTLYLCGMANQYFDYDYSILLYLCELDDSFICDYLDRLLDDSEYSSMASECRRISHLWMHDSPIAERILSAMIDKICSHPLRAPLFQYLIPVREATSARKEFFWERVTQYITSNIDDREKMNGLSIAFADTDDETRERFILTLLSADEKGTLIGHIWIERSSMHGDQTSGFTIVKQREIVVLQNVKRALPRTENYSKHRAWLGQVIAQKEQSIADEKWDLFHGRW